MKALLSLGITSIVLGVLLGALVDFPTGSAEAAVTESASTGDQAFDLKDAEEVGERFNSAYTQVIDDLIAFQRNPDYVRAENRRQELADYADGLIPRFQDLADQLQSMLTGLFAENADMASEYDALVAELEAAQTTGS